MVQFVQLNPEEFVRLVDKSKYLRFNERQFILEEL
jgi:hypothetical protein